jgi:hypothetical protein
MYNSNASAFLLRVSPAPQSVTTAPLIDVSESVPESFLAGWNDYRDARVVDADRALGDEPPPA